MERDSFSDAVETAIKKVTMLEEQDLDRADFDAVEYINRQFPTEASLEGLDAFLARTESEIAKLNTSISESVREQSTAGMQAARELKTAKDSIAELFGKIRDIRAKAEQSEEMVQDICKDIRQLDVAKRHLTTTITMLKRVQMLVSAVDSLQSLLASGSYDNAGQLLLAVGQLLTNFKAYSAVPKVSDLIATVSRLRGMYQERIKGEFERLIELSVAEAMSASDSGRDSASLSTLKQACEVVDALEPSFRDALINSFCENLVNGCQEGKSLETLDNRYKWFKRALRDMDGRYGTVLPKPWRMPQWFYLKFLKVTRMEVDKMLSKFSPDTVNPAILVRALTQTQAFERDLKSRFEVEESKLRENGGLEPSDRARREWLTTLSKDGALSGLPAGGAVPLGPDLSDSFISVVFEPYLPAYVQWEKSKMEEKYKGMEGTPGYIFATGEGSAAEPFPSSSSVLFQFRNAVRRCCEELNLKGQPLFQLASQVKACIEDYAGMMLKALPDPLTAGGAFPGDNYKVTVSVLKLSCTILRTSVYMAEAVGQLSDLIRGFIDEAFKEHIPALFTGVQEQFQFEVVAKAMRVLSSGVACMLDDALTKLCKHNWATVSDVGDQSEYVDMIGAKLRELARAFMPRYMHSLYACKRIGEFGAQQMLLDTVAIREIFLAIPSMTHEEDEPIAIEAPMFVKFVSREVPRVELLLKLVSTPKDRFGESVKALWPDVSAAELSRVMDLRNMSRGEQGSVLDFLGLAPAPAAATATSSVKQAFGSMFSTASSRVAGKK